MTQAIELILAECLEAIENGSMSVADCLQRYPDTAETLEPLLLMAVELQAVPTIAPRPAFQATAKARLFDRLEREEAAAPDPAPPPMETARLPWWRRLFVPAARPVWAAAAVMAVLVFLWIGIARPFAPNGTEIIAEAPTATITPSAAEVALAYWAAATTHLADIEQALVEEDTETAAQSLHAFVAQITQVESAVQVIDDGAARKDTAVEIQTQLYNTKIELAQLPPFGEDDQPVVEAVRTIQQADAALQMVIREETKDPEEALLLEGRWAADSLMAVLQLAENGHLAAAETAAQQYIVQMNVLFELLDGVFAPSKIEDLVNILRIQRELLPELQGQMVLPTAVMEQVWQVWHLLTAQLNERWPTAVAMLELTLTPSLTPSATATATPSMTPTPTLTPSPTHTPTVSPTPTATNTRWPTVTPSPTAVPTVPPPPPPPPPATATFTPSPTAGATATFTPSPTMTYTPTLTQTLTPVPTVTKTPVGQEPSPTPSKTTEPTATKVPTVTKTPQSNYTPLPPTPTPTREWHTPTPAAETLTPTPQIGNILTLVATLIATPSP